MEGRERGTARGAGAMTEVSVRPLLLCATEPEAAPVVGGMRHAQRTNRLYKTALDGAVAGTGCRLVISGIGPVNAAHSLTREIEASRPTVVLQFGIGGAYVPAGVSVGEVVCATEELYGDLGAITPEGLLSMEDLGFPVIRSEPSRFNRFPLDGCLVAYAAEACGATCGPFLTTSQCTGVRALGDALHARTGAICENMEGAAAAHVCALYDVPFLEVRGISNLVEDRDRSAWKVDDAIAVVCDAVVHVLRGIDAVLEGH